MNPPQVTASAAPGPMHDDLAILLGRLQEMIFRHPVAAQFIFRALVVEGRAFAETEQGQVWVERLSRSDLLRQGRLTWEAVSFNALDDREETVMPTAILDAFAKALSERDLHAVIESMLDHGVFRGAPANAG